jgi:hypothetical protein
MFLADHQANVALEQITGSTPNRFPLSESAVIVNANALTTDWSEICPMSDKTYIMGNPPFFGYSFQTDQQREDTERVWSGVRGSGMLDFVTNWYNLAAKQMAFHGGRAAFVSTNSITQGEQPAIVWGELSRLGMRIDFAHRTFKWTNDAVGQAAVHVVIIGFSKGTQKGKRKLWFYPDIKSVPNLREVDNINAYLLNAPDVLVTSRTRPLSPSTPIMDYGSKPTDGGFLSDISPEEAAEIRSKDPIAAKYLRRIIGARELINNIERWCLWLADANPSDLRTSRELSSRIEEVRKMRSESTKAKTRQDATRAHEFQEIRMSKHDYMAVPRVSSAERDYVPIAWFTSDTVTNDAVFVVLDASLDIFGFISSRVFNVWNKVVSGRLKSDTRISNTITYNNFPMPETSDPQRDALESRARDVMAAREKHPDNSLADLYGANSMPTDLRKAHQELDKVVLGLYGLKEQATDSEILEVLFEMYAEQSKTVR